MPTKKTKPKTVSPVPEFLSVTAAAERLGVSAQRVRVLCAAGRIKAVKLSARAWMIAASDCVLPEAIQPGPKPIKKAIQSKGKK